MNKMQQTSGYSRWKELLKNSDTSVILIHSTIAEPALKTLHSYLRVSKKQSHFISFSKQISFIDALYHISALLGLPILALKSDRFDEVYAQFDEIFKILSTKRAILIIEGLDFILSFEKLISAFAYQAEIQLIAQTSQRYSIPSHLKNRIKTLSIQHSIKTSDLLPQKQAEDLGKGYEYQKERLRTLLETGRWNQLKKSLQVIMREAEARGDLRDFLALSEPVADISSIEVRLFRRKILSHLGRYDEAAKECEALLDRPLKTEERLNIQFQLGKSYNWLSHNDKALHCFDQVIRASPEDHLLHIKALIEKALLLLTQNLVSVKTLLDRAELLLKAQDQFDEQTWADVYFAWGRYFDFSEDTLRSTMFFQKAAGSFQMAGLLPDEAQARFNALSISYEGGVNLNRAVNELDTLISHCKSLSLVHTYYHCLALKAFHSNNRGFFQASIDSLKSLPEKLYSNPDNDLELRLVDHLFWTYFEAGAYEQAINVTSSLLTNKTTHLNRGYFLFYKFSQEVLSSYLRGSSLTRTQLLDLKDRYWDDLAVNSNRSFSMRTVLLELNLISQFGFFCVGLSDIESFDVKCRPCFQPELSCLMGWHYLFAGQRVRAETELNRAFQVGNTFGYEYWIARSSMGLAIIDLSRNQFDKAEQSIQQSIDLFKSIESQWHLDFALLIQSIIFQKKYGNANPRNLSKNSFFEEVRSSRPRFFDRLSELLDLPRFNLTTRQGEVKSNPWSTLDKVPGGPHLIFDEIEGELRIGKMRWQLDSRPRLSSLLRFFLVRRGRTASKEELITLVWKEKYNPLVHDPRVHTSIMRINQWLLPSLKCPVIGQINGHYFVHPTCNFRYISKNSYSHFLSDRKKWILDCLDRRGDIKRSEIQRWLKTSSSSVKLELQELVKLEFIKPVGRGKATRYQRA